MGNTTKHTKNSSSLLPNEISDFQNLTSFPGETLVKLHDHYKKFSSHLTDDGVIDFNEFSEILNKDQNMSRRIFNAVDINKDGVINFREFLKYISCFINDSLEEKIDLSFKLFADDKTKTITKDSFIILLKDIINEENVLIRAFIEDDIEFLVDDSFKKIKEVNSAKIKRKLTTNSKAAKINTDDSNLDIDEYKTFIELNPQILDWLIVDVEKIKSVSDDGKKGGSKKINCFG